MGKLKKPEMAHPKNAGDKAYLLDTYAVCTSMDNSPDRKCGQPKFGMEVTVDKLMNTGAKGKDDIKVFARIKFDGNDSQPLWTPIQNLEAR
ncbi:hypothetical protein [Serratia oryzae]|uniref:Uncharacterized protein n=1 Tax=Serratia oryzae TaxID=2034155 RepID=A0A1S8CM73_9GAMM|nr:hypothetical protein [Serratia oryzae]OMQ24597.1 hypothetical protein BMI79_07170 [Serratia oryzae]